MLSEPWDPTIIAIIESDRGWMIAKPQYMFQDSQRLNFTIALGELYTTLRYMTRMTTVVTDTAPMTNTLAVG